MKLAEVVENNYINIIGSYDVEITSITNKTSEVKQGSMFVAISGQNTDSHTLVPNAIKSGATAVVVERPLLGVSVTQVVVNNSRIALSLFAASFYHHPERKMKMIGVTGTNGKTTTTHMIYHILNSCGTKCGLIGTSGCFWQNNALNFGMTTPDPVELEKTLYLMQKDGVQAVAMEVSAHALDLHKIAAITFDVSIFTNLTRDHFDYFKTIDNYKNAKKKLFYPSCSHFAIICTDDNYGTEIAKEIVYKKLTYGSSKVNYEITNVIAQKTGQEFTIKSASKQQKIFIPLFGDYNTKNATAALLCVTQLGINPSKAINALAHLPKIDGRFESMFTPNGAMVIIDYAHSPDGLLNLLQSAKKITNSTTGRLISLFGCGGNRDSGKRAQMGQISESIADFSIITSDNPRFEDPNTIIDAIVEKMSKYSYVRVPDRAQAINLGVKMLFSNDVLVVAGKGNENYLDIQGQKISYSDKQTVEEAIKKLEVKDQ